MSTIPFIETFAKTLFTRAKVEVERRLRLGIPGVISSAISEDGDEFILTTLVPGDAQPSSPAGATHTQAPTHTPAAGPSAAPQGRVLGLDTLEPVKAARLDAVTSLFGAPPSFWGRYIHAPGQRDSSGNRNAGHYSTAENALLKQAGIRLLLIARQTSRVGLGATAGTKDAANNVAAVLELFTPAALAATPDPLVFLDCENDQSQPHLSAEYYAAWSEGIATGSADATGGRVRMRPAVYGSQGDILAWHALREAVGGGAAFHGAWIAAWNEDPSPVPWSDARTTPRGGLPAPVLAWQYSNRGPGCDTDLANPTQAAALLSGLVQPA